MGMFERLGEKVERFKQEAVAASEESAAYRCRNCGDDIYSERETCPECGSSELVRVRTDTEEPAGADPDVESEPDSNGESDGPDEELIREAESESDPESDTE